jgi:hypothetical protein
MTSPRWASASRHFDDTRRGFLRPMPERCVDLNGSKNLLRIQRSAEDGVGHGNVLRLQSPDCHRGRALTKVFAGTPTTLSGSLRCAKSELEKGPRSNIRLASEAWTFGRLGRVVCRFAYLMPAWDCGEVAFQCYEIHIAASCLCSCAGFCCGGVINGNIPFLSPFRPRSRRKLQPGLVASKIGG